MRRLALLLALPLLLLVGCSDDDEVAETEETTTSTTEDASSATTIEADDPADDAVRGREACNDIPPEGSGAGPDELQAIAEEAPDDVAAAIEDVIAADSGGDASAVVDATDRLAEVCQRYGVELERTSGG